MPDFPPYPVGLRLEGRRVVVVGGGQVAQRRIPTLLAAGAEVLLVSPQVTPAIEGMLGELEWRNRGFEAADLDDAWYAIAATDVGSVTYYTTSDFAPEVNPYAADAWFWGNVSAATYPHDVAVTVRRSGQEFTDAEAEQVKGLIRHGTCYRCRIGRARFYFGRTALEAAGRAAAAEHKKKSI